MLRPWVLVVVVLGGCLGSPPVDTQSPVDALPSFETSACWGQEIVAGVPPEAVAPYLPEGFVAEPFPTDGLAGVIAVSVLCQEPATSFGMVIVPVIETPQGMGREDADNQGIVLSVILGADDPIRPMLDAWGWGPTLRNGSATLEDTVPSQPFARAGRTTAETDEGARYVLDTLVRGDAPENEGNRLRLFQVHERQVVATWDWDLTGAHRVYTGEATMEAQGLPPLPEGTTPGLGVHEYADSFLWTRVTNPMNATV
jgi:hypothetical protein